jgi:choline dehydrogenase-like flavoprotein
VPAVFRVKKAIITIYHPTSTCKMGKADDPLAVCDERMRVRGVLNLRVADVSACPDIPVTPRFVNVSAFTCNAFMVFLNQSSNTNAVAIMMGERCAEFVRKDLEREERAKQELEISELR